MLETTTLSQIYVFGVTLAIGFLAGLCFDFYRVVLFFGHPPRWVKLFLDLLGWIILAVLVIAAVLWVNMGEVRFYIFLGMALGALLYYRRVSPVVLRIYKRAFYVIQKTVVSIYYRFLVRPVHKLLVPFNLLFRVARKIIAFSPGKKKVIQLLTRILHKFFPPRRRD